MALFVMQSCSESTLTPPLPQTGLIMSEIVVHVWPLLPYVCCLQMRVSLCFYDVACCIRSQTQRDDYNNRYGDTITVCVYIYVCKSLVLYENHNVFMLWFNLLFTVCQC